MFLGLWLLNNIPLLPIIVLLVITLLSYLLVKDATIIKEYVKTDVINLGTFIISIACLVMMFAGKDKQEVYLDKLFLNGEIKKEMTSVMDDSPQRFHYDYEYKFYPKNENHSLIMEMISWILVFVYIFFPVMNYNFLGKAQKIIKGEQPTV